MSDPEQRGDALYIVGESRVCPVVKIGRAIDPHARLPRIQTGNPRKLHVLHVEPGAGHLEGAMHRALTPFRCTGEWFNITHPDGIEFVLRELAQLLTGPDRSPPSEPAISELVAPEPHKRLTASERRLLDFYSEAVADLAPLMPKPKRKARAGTPGGSS